MNGTVLLGQCTFGIYACICWSGMMWLSVISRRAPGYVSRRADRTSHGREEFPISMALFLNCWDFEFVFPVVYLADSFFFFSLGYYFSGCIL